MSNEKNNSGETVFIPAYPHVIVKQVMFGDSLTQTNGLDKSGQSDVHIELTNATVFSNTGFVQFHWLSGAKSGVFNDDDVISEIVDLSKVKSPNVLVPLDLLKKASGNGGWAGIYYKYTDPDGGINATVFKPATTSDTSCGPSAVFKIDITGLKLNLPAPLPQSNVVTENDLKKSFHVTIPDYTGKVVGQQINLHWKQGSSLDYIVGPTVVQATNIGKDITIALDSTDIKNPQKGDVQLFYTVTDNGASVTSPVSNVSYGQSASDLLGPIFPQNSAGSIDISHMPRIEVDVPAAMTGVTSLNNVTVVLQGLDKNDAVVTAPIQKQSGTVMLPARFNFDTSTVVSGPQVVSLKAYYYIDNDQNKVSPSTKVTVKGSAAQSVTGVLYGAGWEGVCNLGLPETDTNQQALSVLTPELKMKFLPYGSGRYSHSAIGEDGYLYCWGANDNSETGTGIAGRRVERRQAEFAGGHPNIVFVANGSYHTLALDDEGSLWGAGSMHNGRLTLPSHSDDRYSVFTKSSAGKQFSFVSAASTGGGDWDGYSSMGIGKDDGLLYGWGTSDQGVLGQGRDDVPDTYVPALVDAFHKWQWVSHNFYRAAGITTDGDLYTWGSEDGSGVLGRTTTGARVSTPTEVRVPNPKGGKVKFTKVHCGQYFMIALDTEGRVWGWGKNGNCALGQAARQDVDGVPPTLIPGLSGKIVDIAVGYWSAAAVNENGALYAWGYNGHGQLGLNLTQDIVDTPAIVDVGTTKIRRISFGCDSLFALGE